jgi:hypothetical protein
MRTRRGTYILHPRCIPNTLDVVEKLHDPTTYKYCTIKLLLFSTYRHKYNLYSSFLVQSTPSHSTLQRRIPIYVASHHSIEKGRITL